MTYKEIKKLLTEIPDGNAENDVHIVRVSRIYKDIQDGLPDMYKQGLNDSFFTGKENKKKKANCKYYRNEDLLIDTLKKVATSMEGK